MGVQLVCCGGKEAPEAIVRGWKIYLVLPAELQARVWDVVIPGIFEPESALSRARAEAFVEEEAIPIEHASSVLQAAGFLLTQASANDMSLEALRQDLFLLADGTAPGSEILLGKYELVKSDLRNALLQRTLADHGQVLVSLDWRVDQVSASNRGTHLDTTVIFLTLGYLTGDQRKRLSLQVTQEGLKDLRRFLAQFD